MVWSHEDIRMLKAMAKRMRHNALRMAYAAGDNGAHISGSLSCIEIYAALYGKVLRINRDNWDLRDRFIAGKEHARLAEYPAMADVGLFPESWLLDFEKDGGPLTGHPIDTDLGLEFSSCSLGMSLSFGVGKALYAKTANKPYRVICLVGDGECNEGMIWEAAMAAPHYKLDNLIVIVDRNHMSVDGNTEEIMEIGDLEEKFRAFGWYAVTADGHDFASLLMSLNTHHPGVPLAVIAQTVKGKGVSFMENNKRWHQAVLNEAQYQSALAEIEQELV